MRYRKFLAAFFLIITVSVLSACSGGKSQDSDGIVAHTITTPADEDGNTASAEKTDDASASVSAEVQEPSSDQDNETVPETQTTDENGPDAGETHNEAGTYIPDEENPENIILRFSNEVDLRSDETTGKTICDVRIDSMNMSYKYLEKYPELGEAIEEQFSDTIGNYPGLIDELASKAALDKTGDEYHYRKTLEPMRSDSNIVSIAVVVNEHTNDESENNMKMLGFNYDPVSGRLFTLRELLKDEEAYIDLLYKDILQLGSKPVYETEDDIKNALRKAIDDDTLQFFVTNSMMMVAFNPMEMLENSEIQLSVITFRDHENLFSDRILSSPDEYFIPLNGTVNVFDDFIENDNYLYLIVDTGILDEYDQFDQIQIESGFDRSIIAVIDAPAACYAYEMYYLRKGDRKFLYIEYTHSSDDYDLRIYEIISGEDGKAAVVRVDSDPDPDGATVSLKPEMIAENCTYSPDSIVMGLRYDVIGTNTLYSFYRTGDDGLPVPTENYYCFAVYPELTLKEDLNVEMIEDTSADASGQAATLLKGEHVTLFGTDTESFVDLISTEHPGAYYRMKIRRNNEYPLYSADDSRSFDDIFDGILYAD